MNDRAEAVCDLVLAVIRLAICDYVGIAYGHDGPIPPKRTRTRAYAGDAEHFLAGPWAAYLADQVGLRSDLLWREARDQLKAISSATWMERAA
jgi:hypothetical protein